MKIILAVILGVIVLWSIGWFAIATAVERHIDLAMHTLERDGTRVACAQRKIGGYPFRLEVRCGPDSAVRTREATLYIGGLTAVGLIYQPSRVIVEAKGPARYRGNNGAFRGDWTLAQVSIGFDLGDLSSVSLGRIDFAATGIGVSPGTAASGEVPAIVAERFELHTRENPDDGDALDVAISLDDAEFGDGVGPVDLDLIAAVDGGRRLFGGDAGELLRLVAAEGLPVEVSRLTIAADGTKVSILGRAMLRASGLIDGEFVVAIAGSDVPYLDLVFDPKSAAEMEIFLQNVLAYGRETEIDGDPARSFQVSVDGGNVRAGLVPLGHIPALAVAR
jgi:hypothetical protein